jgi:PAS domain S-box-containing protein
MVIVLTVTSWFITTRLAKVSQAQERAQAAAHDVSELLVLTHEYALYGEERAAQQWGVLHAAILANLEAGARDAVSVPPDALAEAKVLPELFRQLVHSLANRTDLQLRQKNLLLNQLQASSQIFASSVHEWGITIAKHRQQVEHDYRTLAITIPLLMFLVLVMLSFLINHRVLQPLQKLHQAVLATAKGDMPVRSATGTNDEFGELSRTFDAMAIDLVAGLKQEIMERQRLEEERTVVEEALKESEFFFKESQRSAHVGSYKADFISNRWTSSEVLDTIFGIDATYDRSVNGWLEIIHPEDRGMMQHYLSEEVIGKHKPFAREYRIIRQNDGEIRWVSGLGEVTCDGNGMVVSLYGTIHDVTERKKLEEERLLLTQQLLQSQKLESLGVLAGGIAHDFNNILAIIMGNCSLAKLNPDKFADNLDEIEKASERAAALCRQMLAYAGKSQFVQARINLTELVDETVSMLKASLTQNVEIRLDLETSEVPFVKGDASQLSQIAMNLIINASEAIGAQQGVVRVALAIISITAEHAVRDHQGKEIPPGSYACLEVTDNGCGMDNETRQRIFEPFYTTKFTGRGLGMSAVLGIIMSHNGALQLFTQQGQGTTFKVYLPAQGSSATGAEATALVSSAPRQGRGTILLVEDEEQVKATAGAMMRNFGFTVIEAANGKEALELYQQHGAAISLVVTDMGMPVMDGYTLLRELKKLAPELPVIISSGFGEVDVTSRIPPADIAGLIGKPYNVDNLWDVLKGFVQE